ncbi:hypothetical protein V6N13_116546 [Hibiscus sabdariffa]
MHKPLQRNLARYRELGNGVIGSTAQAFPRPSADHARGIRYQTERVKRESNYGGRDESKRQRAESQWIVAARPLCIVAARPLCHLQYPVAYLSRLQRILPAARWKLRFRAARTTCPTRVLRHDSVPLGAKGPLLRVGNRATGACVASSPDSDLEAFSHNPAHGSFAPLAFQPSAMTNCANQRFLSY